MYDEYKAIITRICCHALYSIGVFIKLLGINFSVGFSVSLRLFGGMWRCLLQFVGGYILYVLGVWNFMCLFFCFSWAIRLGGFYRSWFRCLMFIHHTHLRKFVHKFI